MQEESTQVAADEIEEEDLSGEGAPLPADVEAAPDMLALDNPAVRIMTLRFNSESGHMSMDQNCASTGEFLVMIGAFLGNCLPEYGREVHGVEMNYAVLKKNFDTLRAAAEVQVTGKEVRIMRPGDPGYTSAKVAAAVNKLN